MKGKGRAKPKGAKARKSRSVVSSATTEDANGTNQLEKQRRASATSHKHPLLVEDPPGSSIAGDNSPSRKKKRRVLQRSVAKRFFPQPADERSVKQAEKNPSAAAHAAQDAPNDKKSSPELQRLDDNTLLVLRSDEETVADAFLLLGALKKAAREEPSSPSSLEDDKNQAPSPETTTTLEPKKSSMNDGDDMDDVRRRPSTAAAAVSLRLLKTPRSSMPATTTSTASMSTASTATSTLTPAASSTTTATKVTPPTTNTTKTPVQGRIVRTDNNSSSSRKDYDWQVRPGDVITGIGPGLRQHPGNLQFRDYCAQAVQAVPKLADRIAHVLELVQSQNPPGRFLERVTTKGDEKGGNNDKKDANETAVFVELDQEKAEVRIKGAIKRTQWAAKKKSTTNTTAATTTTTEPTAAVAGAAAHNDENVGESSPPSPTTVATTTSPQDSLAKATAPEGSSSPKTVPDVSPEKTLPENARAIASSHLLSTTEPQPTQYVDATAMVQQPQHPQHPDPSASLVSSSSSLLALPVVGRDRTGAEGSQTTSSSPPVQPYDVVFWPPAGIDDVDDESRRLAETHPGNDSFRRFCADAVAISSQQEQTPLANMARVVCANVRQHNPQARFLEFSLDDKRYYELDSVQTFDLVLDILLEVCKITTTTTTTATTTTTTTTGAATSAVAATTTATAATTTPVAATAAATAAAATITTTTTTGEEEKDEGSNKDKKKEPKKDENGNEDKKNEPETDERSKKDKKKEPKQAAKTKKVKSKANKARAAKGTKAKATKAKATKEKATKEKAAKRGRKKSAWPLGPRKIKKPVHRNDVVLGRGCGIVSHHGNKQFRFFCWERRERYARAARDEKRQIGMEVCDKVAQQDPPGRFIQFIGVEPMEISSAKALEKACQALREQKWDKREPEPDPTAKPNPAPSDKKNKKRSIGEELPAVFHAKNQSVKKEKEKKEKGKKAGGKRKGKQCSRVVRNVKKPKTKGIGLVAPKKASTVAPPKLAAPRDNPTTTITPAASTMVAAADYSPTATNPAAPMMVAAPSSNPTAAPMMVAAPNSNPTATNPAAPMTVAAPCHPTTGTPAAPDDTTTATLAAPTMAAAHNEAPTAIPAAPVHYRIPNNGPISLDVSDVLVGRKAESRSHPGNRLFAGKCLELRAEFAGADRQRKHAITQRLFHIVGDEQKGRFVDRIGDAYFELPLTDDKVFQLILDYMTADPEPREVLADSVVTGKMPLGGDTAFPHLNSTNGLCPPRSPAHHNTLGLLPHRNSHNAGASRMVRPGPSGQGPPPPRPLVPLQVQHGGQQFFGPMHTVLPVATKNQPLAPKPVPVVPAPPAAKPQAQIELTPSPSSPATTPGTAPQTSNAPISLNCNDVVLGRGSRSQVYPGNQQFRYFVDSARAEYQRAPRGLKTKIAQRVLNMVREQNPPGRFLKQQSIGIFIEASDNLAVEKTRQALRNEI